MIKSLLHRTAGTRLAVLLMACTFCGCSTMRSVDNMEGDLDAMRPSIEAFPALQDSIGVIASRVALIDQMAATLEAVHADLASLPVMANDVANIGKQLDLVSRDLDRLVLLRIEITDIQKSLGKLDDFDDGINSIDLRLQSVSDLLKELQRGMAFVNTEIVRLGSLDTHLVAVNDSVKRLHMLVTIAAFAVPALALLLIVSIYNQWRTRRLLARMAMSYRSGDA